MTQILELVDKDFKVLTINMLKDLKRKIWSYFKTTQEISEKEEMEILYLYNIGNGNINI